MTKGFTLLEMLIAMVVIAAVGISVSAAIGNVAQQTYSLERRTIAHWVAQNHISRMRISKIAANKLPDAGTEYTRVYMGKRDWELKTKISDTQFPTLKRVEIAVYEVGNNRNVIGPFDHLVAFIGAN